MQTKAAIESHLDGFRAAAPPVSVTQEPLEAPRVFGQSQADIKTLPAQTRRQNPNTDTTKEDRALQAIAERIAADDARRRDLRRAANESPLGESLFNLADFKKQRQEAQAGKSTLGADPSFVQNTEAFQLPEGKSPVQGKLLGIGTIIPAALMTEIRSELPGLVKAQVTEDVYDTITGYHLLIPRGSMLIGSYGNKTTFGQSRLFVYWTHLRYPDGTTLNLERTGGVDQAGASGIAGKRQTGFLSAILGAALINLAQRAGQKDTTSSDLAEAARIATGTAAGTVTSRYLEEQISRGTKFKIAAGKIINVMLEKDYHLKPWGQG